MALVKNFEEDNSIKYKEQTEVDCTYSFVKDSNGENYLQFDTYGSDNRKMKGKKSQSLRFDFRSIEKLEMIIAQFKGCRTVEAKRTHL